MNREKNKKKSFLAIFFFVLGLLLYLFGLFLLFGTLLGKINFISNYLSFLPSLSESPTSNIKIYGMILFAVGFFLFMVSVIILYKDNKIAEDNKNLIIEGKADIITIIIMTYVLVFMLVICLILNQLVGALLFGVTIIIQSVTNSLLIKYYNKTYKK